MAVNAYDDIIPERVHHLSDEGGVFARNRIANRVRQVYCPGAGCHYSL